MAELMLRVGSIGHSFMALAATVSGPTLWYVTRACAVAAYVLLAVSVALGTLRAIARRTGEHLSWLADELHQFIATLAGVLIAAHLVTLVLDTYKPFTVANILLPLDEPYRPFAVVLGVYAFYGMVVLLFSSWLRRRVPHRFWRAIHYLSFLTFALITAHGLLAGSDAQEAWMRGLYAWAAGSVCFAMLVRFVFSRPPKAARAEAVAPRRETSRA
jgi:predicted ferric reductase